MNSELLRINHWSLKSTQYSMMLYTNCCHTFSSSVGCVCCIFLYFCHSGVTMVIACKPDMQSLTCRWVCLQEGVLVWYLLASWTHLLSAGVKSLYSYFSSLRSHFLSGFSHWAEPQHLQKEKKNLTQLNTTSLSWILLLQIQYCSVFINIVREDLTQLYVCFCDGVVKNWIEVMLKNFLIFLCQLSS